MKSLVFMVLLAAAAEGQLLSSAKETYENLRSRLKCADMPTNGTCAILFDEGDCTGWQLAINEGYTELPTQTVGDFLGGTFIDNPKKNDAEAVLVREGCMFVGYDHEKGSSRGLGKAIVVAAINGHTYQKFDEDGYKDLDEEISSVDCVCNGFSFMKNTNPSFATTSRILADPAATTQSSVAGSLASGIKNIFG